MKRICTLIISTVLISMAGHAQVVPSPVIKQSGKDWETFKPKNWTVIRADSADFNNDLQEDYVFILQADEDYLNKLNYNTKLNASPRVLVILMGAGGDSLVLGIKSDSVVLNANSGEGDPLVQGTGIKTDGNIFEINYSGGQIVQWTGQYKFGYNPKTKEWMLAYFRGTEYNTNDEDSPIKVFEVDFVKKFMKQDKVKTPMPNLPKLYLDKFRPRTVTIAPGVLL